MKKVWLLATCVAFLSGSAQAVEPLFTTLTRRPTPRRHLPPNVSVITAEEIDDLGAKSIDEVLDILPAVDVSKSGSLGSFSSVRVRGVPTSNQVQVLIDEQPIGGIGIQSIDISLIPVDDIERIEVIRGGSSVLYGPNAVGGIVHIITKKQPESPWSASVGAETRSFDTTIGSVRAGARADRMDVFVTGGAFDSDGYQENAWVEDRYASANAGFTFKNGARISADVSYDDREQGNPSGTPVPFSEWDGEREKEATTPDSEIAKTTQRSRLQLAVPAGDVLIRSLVYRNEDDYTLRSTPTGAPDSRFENVILGQDIRAHLGAGVTAGVAYERDERESLGQNPHHAANLGVYLQRQFSLGSWHLTPAVRWDEHSAFGTEVNPRLAAVYEINDAWRIGGSAARSVRAPTLVDLFIELRNPPAFAAFDYAGNPDLEPEIAWTYDVGVNYEPASFLEAELTGFFTRLRDRIVNVDSDANGFVDTAANVSRAEIAGAEAVLRFTTGPLRHEANYTYLRAKGTTATSSAFVPLRLTPKHALNYIARWRIAKRLNLVNVVRHVGAQFEFDGDGGDRLRPYTLWDARIEAEWRGYRAFAGIHNITDRIYADSFTFGNHVPMPGRNYRAGVSLAFGPVSNGR